MQPLLQSSGKLSRKDTDTKKQTLKKILNRERAGLELSKEEKELLYPEIEVDEEEVISKETQTTNSAVSNDTNSKKKNKKSKKSKNESESEPDGVEASVVPASTSSPKEDKTEDTSPVPQIEGTVKPSSGIDFAAQMMASLSKLNNETKNNAAPSSEESQEDVADSVPAPKRYVPSNPTVVKTAASMGLQSSSDTIVKRQVLKIKRPEDLEKTRYDLPVAAMEFEIMDAIRNNDVTIISAETGSGKSTQIPGYLYEAGMSMCPSDPQKSYLIGITQPRRVAAVSTAKRVCYEMGQGDGQCIKNSGGKKGNLVAYKTRYESAGVGEETCIQFMTDGILLNEIQSDLLLRRYSVIVLDESHERNLNTDVLIGLLSVALPLRRKAAQEDPSIVPLKLILMSATLRVEDFTKNDKLFPTGPPAVVRVPGRNHPVTIHHSKVTELDDYGKLEFLQSFDHFYKRVFFILTDYSLFRNCGFSQDL